MCTHHIFTICSSVHGHIGQLHFLAVVNRATMNMDVQYLWGRMWGPLSVYPGLVWLVYLIYLAQPFIC